MIENKGDLISREVLKEKLNKKAFDLANGGMIFIESINHIIDNAPTVEIPVARWDAYCEGQKVGYEKALSERTQGKWIELRDYDFKCSVCGYSLMDKYNFCPECGADMRGKQP